LNGAYSEYPPMSALRSARFQTGGCLYLILTVSPSLLAGCRSHRKKVTLLTPTTGVVIWDAVHSGAVLQSRECGGSVRYNGPPRDDDLRPRLYLFERATETRHGAAITLARLPPQSELLQGLTHLWIPVMRRQTDKASLRDAAPDRKGFTVNAVPGQVD